MSDERKRLVMIVLLVALAAVVVWRYVVPTLSSDGGGLGGRVGGSVSSAAADVDVATLDLGALEAEARNYEPGRNLFEYHRKPPPPPPEPQGPTAEELAAQREAERLRREAEARAAEAATTQAEAKPQPPSFQLTFLGSFGPEGRKIAVFTDGEEIYNALIGDVLNEKFVVADIGFESVSITYVGFPEEPATRVGIGG